MRIGVISDTHGLLRPQAASALAGCDHILHAGDVGSDEVLAALQQIAPVHAIRGNVDHDGICGSLPLTELVELVGRPFYVIHRRENLRVYPAPPRIAAVIFGHSHQPDIAWQNGVLYFNPGSAGPRRFRLPVTIGFLQCSADEMVPGIHALEI